MGNESFVDEQALSEESRKSVERGLEQARNGEFVDSPKDEELSKLLENVDSPENQDYLAAFYEKHGKMIAAGISSLGKNALQRIIMNVYMGEFAPKQYKPNMKSKTGKLEAKIAYHFDEGVYKRLILRFEHEFKMAQEAMAKEQEDLKEIEKLNQEAMSPEAKAELERLTSEQAREKLTEEAQRLNLGYETKQEENNS